MEPAGSRPLGVRESARTPRRECTGGGGPWDPTVGRGVRAVDFLDSAAVVMRLQGPAPCVAGGRGSPFSTIHSDRRLRASSSMFEHTCVETLVTGRLHPDPADARSPLLRAFRMSGTSPVGRTTG